MVQLKEVHEVEILNVYSHESFFLVQNDYYEKLHAEHTHSNYDA